MLKPGVPKRGYVYPLGYICLSNGVNLKLAIEGKYMFTYYSFPIIYAYISEHNHGWRNIFQSGGHKSSEKNCRKIMWFELASVTSQALKYDIIKFFSMF